MKRYGNSHHHKLYKDMIFAYGLQSKTYHSYNNTDIFHSMITLTSSITDVVNMIDVYHSKHQPVDLQMNPREHHFDPN